MRERVQYSGQNVKNRNYFSEIFDPLKMLKMKIKKN